MTNFIYDKNKNQLKDEDLVKSAVSGNGKSLEQLILRYHSWIYNIAFKMVMDHEDSKDITHEVIIKLITSLSSYDKNKSAFKTWLNRIAVNHILNIKKKKFELRINDFNRYIDLIDNLPEKESSHPESALLEKEFQVGCMSGMLICLKREERMAFILGGIFDLQGSLAAEIMDISHSNFRKKLSRARTKLFDHMSSVCGLVDSSNKCRCSKKFENFIDLKMLDPNKPKHFKEDTILIKEVLENRLSNFADKFYDPFINLFREHPYYESVEVITWLKKMIDEKDFTEIFDLK